MEPAAKKARTEEEAAEEAAEAEGMEEAAMEVEAGAEEEVAPAEEQPKEPEPPKELEGDAPADKGPKLKEAVGFNTADTTLNVMVGSTGNILMPLTDGGLQFFLAGARANVGVTSGRYMFEVKVIEIMSPFDDPTSRQKVTLPRSQLRIGVATSSSTLFLGEDEHGVCFDTEGIFMHEKKRIPAGQKFGSGDILAIVLNLDSSSPNANTISLFRNGVRASQPQPIPENLLSKPLFPTITFKNVTVHYNFGPVPLVSLPFKCRMLKDASEKDTTVVPAPDQPKDGRFEVLFPICLPDEGTFDWLDVFLARNPHYTELSDRVILSWAEKSGIWRPKGYTARSCNDKPEMGFGIPMLDDLSVRRVLQAVAPLQRRHYIVMEVKSNLVKDERKDMVSRWPAAGYKRVAHVMVGEPSNAVKKRGQELTLKQKQEAADLEFRAKQAEEKRKRLLEKRQKQLERERKKNERKAKKLQEQMKKRLEEERKKKEAADKGEEYVPPEEEKEPEEPEEEHEEEEEEPLEEEPPKVTLTAEEKKLWFRKPLIPDLTLYTLNTSFIRFSLPDKDEGFDEIVYDWTKADKAKEYLKQWVQNKKLTSRIEDLQPSEWFNNKYKEWQKVLQQWHSTLNTHKAKLAKELADAAAKEAKRKAKEAAKEARAKAIAEGKEVEEVAEEDEEEAEQKVEKKAKFDDIDVFGVEDVLDVGGGEPLFTAFNFEDWAMMSLRFELHLLTHSFRRDVSDPDRIGIHLEHLPFYYNKYFKKALNNKYYGMETVKEVLDLVKDTVTLNPKNQVLEAQLPDDMESLGIFAMLTEESRRDRTRRIDMGDESARLKLAQPQAAGVAALAAISTPPGVRPPMPAPAPVAPRPPYQVPTAPPLWQTQQPQGNWFQNQARPPFGAGPPMGGFRPQGGFQARGYATAPPAWRAFGGR